MTLYLHTPLPGKYTFSYRNWLGKVNFSPKTRSRQNQTAKARPSGKGGRSQCITQTRRILGLPQINKGSWFSHDAAWAPTNPKHLCGSPTELITLKTQSKCWIFLKAPIIGGHPPESQWRQRWIRNWVGLTFDSSFHPTKEPKHLPAPTYQHRAPPRLKTQFQGQQKEGSMGNGLQMRRVREAGVKFRRAKGA